MFQLHIEVLSTDKQSAANYFRAKLKEFGVEGYTEEKEEENN